MPHGGRIHIDRTLPFLVVYRHPHKRSEEGTDRLIKAEASYLIASDDPKLKRSLSHLIQNVVEVLSKECGAFLIIEIWTQSENNTTNENDNLPPKPGFRIITNSVRPPTKTIDALQKTLKHINILKQRVNVDVKYNKVCSPPELPPLISNLKAAKLNCFMLGVEVQPIYYDQKTKAVYPLVLRRLQRGFDIALRQAVFEFSRERTIINPVNYQTLGRRAVVRAVWEIDKKLANISNSFDFLLQVTPVNTNSAWVKFQNSHFEKTPELYYRPMLIDPVLVKRRLYQIPIERVEDPTLAFLFRETQLEIDRKLTMLLDRSMPEFLHGSLQLFGGKEKNTNEQAKEILLKVTPHSRGESAKESITAHEFAKRAKSEIDYFRQSCPHITNKVEIRADTIGLMVSRGNLLIGKQIKIPTSRVEALIQHEVGTHILTYINGRAQPLNLLYCGLPDYEELQEGLAVLAEYLVGGLSRPRLRLLAGRVIAAYNLVSGATFVENFRELNQKWGFNQYTAFTIAVRIYRGGGLTKDVVYLRGLIELLKYLKGKNEIDQLFLGKIAIKQIPLIKDLQYRQVLKTMPLRPRYMNDPKVEKRLAKLKSGLTPLDLTERN
ncbi:DUF1704 domain-containing protein [bacterium]|nr:DUF1704 domain-containing protein [bacterium]